MSVSLVNAVRATCEDLRAALEWQLRLKPMPIGEALLALAKITPEQLSEALHRQSLTRGVPLGQILLDMGLVTTVDLQLALVTKMGYPFVDLKLFPIDTAALRRVPAATAIRLRVLPLMEWQSTLVVAMTDPLQFRVLEELEFTSQRKVRPVVTTSADLTAQIAKAYRGIGMADNLALQEPTPRVEREAPAAAGASSEQDAWMLAAELNGGEAKPEQEEKPLEQSDNTLVRLINSMISEAYHQRASDIHIEPYPGREKVSIRFRIDGELRPYLELPPSYRNALTARIKIMSDLDISERRKPQDGKIAFAKYGGLPLELRVATIPTAHGLEDIVMRLLTAFRVVPLEALELAPDKLELLLQVIERPNGLFLCVGPTGSGKTTTLHSVLQRLNRPNRKIWTAEDPVEITQHGLRQIQVNPRIGWTFAAALRSLLRADPDVIMVGEIRDPETAEMAIEASLTGHLVLSTLHTNSAADTIVRLNDLGVDSFSFADSLQGILAQRLVRKLCASCKQSRPMLAPRLREITDDYQRALPPGHALRDTQALHEQWRQRYAKGGVMQDFQAPGCDHCGNTGYMGRMPLHELLAATPAIRLLVQKRARPVEILALALSEGMRSLRQDGIEKVLAGLTSLAEVRASTND
ncbi:MAG: GspE/PulE family protein [Burkholderiales bacterium]|nr:GspE/PulE family protein [Burkholderiales bacterium]